MSKREGISKQKREHIIGDLDNNKKYSVTIDSIFHDKEIEVTEHCLM